MPDTPASSVSDLKSHEASDSPLKLNVLEKAGVKLEISLDRFFTAWGVFCARHPIPVIVIGFAIAIGLCAGIQSLEVTTDPVKLWGGDEMQTRIEKDFFDSTFRPFYRAENVIVRYKEGSGLDWVKSSSLDYEYIRT